MPHGGGHKKSCFFKFGHTQANPLCPTGRGHKKTLRFLPSSSVSSTTASTPSTTTIPAAASATISFILGEIHLDGPAGNLLEKYHRNGDKKKAMYHWPFHFSPGYLNRPWFMSIVDHYKYMLHFKTKAEWVKFTTISFCTSKMQHSTFSDTSDITDNPGLILCNYRSAKNKGGCQQAVVQAQSEHNHNQSTIIFRAQSQCLYTSDTTK